MPGAIAAVFLLFNPTTFDDVTPALLGGPDAAMTGNLIQLPFGLVNNGPMGAALSAVLALWIAAVAAVFLVLNRAAQALPA
jgi:spermidine/putrescine transport system permease protein